VEGVRGGWRGQCTLYEHSVQCIVSMVLYLRSCTQPLGWVQAESQDLVSVRLVDGIQRIYDGGWDPSEESEESKSEQVMHCMDPQHCLH
jgi:hypothetical protein